MKRGISCHRLWHAPAARFGAALALALNLILHGSPLWVPAAEALGIEVCTADGLETWSTEAPPLGGDPGDTQTPKAICVLCVLQAAALLMPGEVGAARFQELAASRDEPVHHLEVAGLPAGYAHRSRAPPRLA